MTLRSGACHLCELVRDLSTSRPTVSHLNWTSSPRWKATGRGWPCWKVELDQARHTPRCWLCGQWLQLWAQSQASCGVCRSKLAQGTR